MERRKSAQTLAVKLAVRENRVVSKGGALHKPPLLFIKIKTNKMDAIYLKTIQNRAIKLLKIGNDPLRLSSQDNCSEMARIVGCWILQENPMTSALVLKGENIMGIKKKCHDVLIVEKKNKFYLIDPTVWQFFKNKKNILLAEKNTMKDCIEFAEKFYEGRWAISETINKNCFKNIKKWEEVIKLNTCL